jgi:hypothetical protein
MYGELQGIRNKTIVIKYSEVRIPSSEGIVKVAFGIFSHRPRCELSNIRKQGRNSVAWDNYSAEENYVFWIKWKDTTYSEKRLWLILHIRICIWLEFKFVENHTDSQLTVTFEADTKSVVVHSPNIPQVKRSVTRRQQHYKHTHMRS